MDAIVKAEILGSGIWRLEALTLDSLARATVDADLSTPEGVLGIHLAEPAPADLKTGDVLEVGGIELNGEVAAVRASIK